MKIQDKKLALGELRYELEMFNKTSEHLELSKCEDKTERRAYLESFLLHTRNIVDFLEDANGKDDITCSDFGICKVSIQLPSNNTNYKTKNKERKSRVEIY